MAQKHAEIFIKEIVKDNDLRKSLYRYDSSKNVMAAIQNIGYQFTLHDFEESINHLKIESPHEEQALMLDELLLWWNILMSDGSLAQVDVPSCTPSACGSCTSCG